MQGSTNDRRYMHLVALGGSAGSRRTSTLQSSHPWQPWLAYDVAQKHSSGGPGQKGPPRGTVDTTPFRIP